MSEKQKIPRDLIQDAIRFLDSVKLELEGGLDPEKGFISKSYVEDKLRSFLWKKQRIFSEAYTDEVEPLRGTLSKTE